MTLPAGARLGPYEIVALTGAGGMGQVYHGRDTRLNRTVAIKLLQPEFADRPDRRQRLETEARAIASLSHPHICTLFDVGEHEARAFLVMEYLDGETLEDRLSAGPLPAPDVLRYGTQIADALDCAHRAHVVHRDLKPSNVMLTRTGAKLLDFGLAKAPALAAAAGVATASFSTRQATAEGTLIGTFQYMSPEQLEGRLTDARTDIFAFGALLYEMATGRKAFDGASQASLIASILTGQPPAISAARDSALDDDLPPTLDYIVERCLAKNPDERWQSARDLKAALQWTAEVKPPARLALRVTRSRAWAGRIAWTAGATALLLGVGWIAGAFRRPQPQATQFVVALPAGTTIGGARDRVRLAASADGRQLAFVATTEGREALWVQSFGSVTPRQLEGTDGAASPFWSPDSRFIAFFSPGDGLLKKVDASGGPPRPICTASLSGLGTWARDGTILFTEFRKGIYRVSAEGGTPAAVTQVDRARRELNHFWPSMLPDGRHFLYTATGLDQNGHRSTPVVYVGSLESPERREVTRLHSRMVYAPPGRVLYVHEGALLAQSFDLDSFHLTGEPVRVSDGVDYFRSTGAGAFAVSEAGVLAYHGGTGLLELAWFDRQGTARGTVGSPQRFGNVRFSPDGEQAAVEVIEPRLGTSDIWLYQLSGSGSTRFTTDLNDETFPLWSPDSRQIVFGSDRGTGMDASSDFFMKTADGMSTEEVFFVKTGFQTPEDWSGDGSSIAYTEDSRETGNDVWIIPLSGDRQPRPLLQTRFDEWGARFSPDSAWVAFVSDESGTAEVYVAPFHAVGAKTRISNGGGVAPRWRHDGKELFYLSGDGKSVVAVPVDLRHGFKSGLPFRLFTIATETGFRNRARNMAYDVSRDGQRFLINVAARNQASSRITVVLNWTALLDR